MFNKNTFKTVCLFLGLLLVGVAIDFFMSRDAISFSGSPTRITANATRSSWFFKK